MKRVNNKRDPREAGPVDIEVGVRIRAARNAKGLTQTELGESVGVSFQQIQKMESGTNRVSVGRLIEVCDALGLPVGEMLKGLQEGTHSGKLPETKTFPPEVMRFAERFEKLGQPRQRKAILSFMDKLGGGA